MKKIKYVGFYDLDKYEHEKRNYTISARNKMDYIISTLEELNYSVEIISPSWSGSEVGRYNERKEDIFQNSKLTLFKTFGAKIRVMKISRILMSWFKLIKYLFENIERGESILVYHSLMLIFPLVIIKKIKKIHLILEVEEIYTDVIETNKILQYIEMRFINKADSYILSNDFLSEKIINKEKEKIVLYGIYEKNNYFEIGREKCNITQKISKDRINLVYSGVIDKSKGSFRSVEIGEFLNESYHIHIIGFGSESNIEELQKYILKVSKKTKCKITYDGMFKGEDYKVFLRNCKIGLCTQDKIASFSETSFPSKIMSYLCNGLKVVSVNLNSISKSKIASELILYEDEEPQKIAQLIMSSNEVKINENYKFIEELHDEFKYYLAKMILE